MQPPSKSSFIPKKSIKRVERIRGRRRVYILSYVAYGLFLSTILAAVGVFLYTSVLDNTLQQKIAELDAERNSFEDEDLDLIRDWEKRLRVSESLFYQHLSPHRVLTALEENTATDIRYTSFTYSHTPGQPAAQVTIAGESEQFDSVAFQSDQFLLSSILRSASLEGVTKEISVAPETQAGGSSASTLNEAPAKPVRFSVSLGIPASTILFDLNAYEKLVTEEFSDDTGFFGNVTESEASENEFESEESNSFENRPSEIEITEPSVDLNDSVTEEPIL